jgi:lysozyme family protein
MTNDEIIGRIIADEGGDRFVDNPADPGGATKFGITARGIAQFLGRTLSPDEISALTLDDAKAFYRWLLKSSGIERIHNETLRWFVFDAAVHMGNTQAIKLLQRALGVHDDGVLGPVTLAATPYIDATKLCRLVSVEQMLFYGRLAAKNLTDADRDGVPDQLEFLPGYLNRLARKMREVS